MYIPKPSILIPLFLTIFLFSVAKSDFDSVSAIRLPSDGLNGDDICVGSGRPDSCPVNCFKTDPVCGVDGVTYWCGCAEAKCAGVKVAKFGYCEVLNGGSGLVSGQALLLVHMVWLIVLGFSLLFGIF